MSINLYFGWIVTYGIEPILDHIRWWTKLATYMDKENKKKF